MLKCLALAALAALAVVAPATAAPKLEMTTMMGRWYEVARTPNSLQTGCQAGASEWKPAAQGYAVVQSCHKGAPDGPVKQWRAKATVADPGVNSKFRMAFFGGMVTQEYNVLEHRPDQGWLILGTADGKYLWLMSQRPTLPGAFRAAAVAKIRQLGFDPSRLEFPLPARL